MTNSVENAHSFAGLYSLSNPLVTWLISRGAGELVALTPGELRKGITPPTCHWQPMLYRGAYWLCREPECGRRQRIPMRLQKIPPPPFSTFDVIGKTVEVQYRRDDGEARASWKWIVDGKVWA